MQLFYAPDITSGLYHLNEEESKHCIRVLRFKKGDSIKLTDGAGNLFRAELISDNPKKCSLKIINKEKGDDRRDYYLHLAVAPTKNINRFEFLLEKATEIGVDEITPLICEKSERRLVKPERMEKIIASAMKQSLKTYLPKLNPAESFSEFVGRSFISQKFMAYIADDVTQTLKNIYKKGGHVTIIIGPEGDFSSEEVESATQMGFNPISLGKSRLRTETAGLVACHTISLLNE